MIFQKKYIRFTLLILVMTILSMCAKNPVSGMPDFVTITEQQEISIGASYHQSILEEHKLLKDREINQYFNSLGKKIAKQSHRPELKWHFTLIDNPTFNAFATPGGYVYFYRGILAYFNSEAELAGVIGHEIAHITARHAVRGMSTAQVTNILIGLVASRVPGSQLTNNAFNLMNQIINRGYSRKYELEADKIAEEYLLRSGYDPSAMSSFLKTMKNVDDLEVRIAKEEGRQPNIGYHGIFSTHPATEKRIEALESKSKNKQKSDNKEKFLKMIDGLPYGSSPDEGFVKNNIFYHADLAIKFNILEPWILKNLPDKLIISKNNSSMIIRYEELLKDDIDNGITPKKFLDEGINKTSFLSRNELIESESFNTNNLNAHTILYSSKGFNKTTYKRFTAIFDINNKNPYNTQAKPKVWIFVTTSDNLKDDNESKIMFKKFSKMTKNEIDNAKGLKIRVIRFREGMTYEKLAKQSPLGKYAEDKLRLLNGHYPDQDPNIGDLIKIVE
ncbi:MAG: hypothetical protein CMD65_04935 [Gammaproteobacteria bacterium]|nr:hypothetical protein [Gammaproteobacteria bacterium]